MVVIDSLGFSPVTVDISDLSCREHEKGTTEALVRGIASRFADLAAHTGFARTPRPGYSKDQD